MSKKERIDKILSHMGYGSRKEIKSFVKSGRVEVDNKPIKDSSMKVDPYTQLVSVDGKILEYKEFIYIMMNKPAGVVSSTDDPISRTVIDLLDKKYLIFEPFPVGRLDKDTEGLLILSNDGQMAHQLLSPKKHVNKKYYAEVDGVVEDKDIGTFEKGVVIDDGYETMPAQLEIIESGESSRTYLTIKEGKFHQVKRMFKSIGKNVTYLKRVSMGNLKLDDNLLTGEYRELTDEEIQLLKNS